MPGYFPKPTKSVMVVRPLIVERAKARFDFLRFQVSTSTRHMGGFIGDKVNMTSHIKSKVGKWLLGITYLAIIAKPSSQATVAAFQQSYQHKWQYLHHPVSDV